MRFVIIFNNVLCMYVCMCVSRHTSWWCPDTNFL